jgi:hypothetical protein
MRSRFKPQSFRVKKDEMGWVYSMHGRDEKYNTEYLSENWWRKKGHLDDLGVYGEIILKRILEK